MIRMIGGMWRPLTAVFQSRFIVEFAIFISFMMFYDVLRFAVDFGWMTTSAVSQLFQRSQVWRDTGDWPQFGSETPMGIVKQIGRVLGVTWTLLYLWILGLECPTCSMCFNKCLMMLMLIKCCGHCDDSTFFSYNIYNKVALRLTMGRKAPKPGSPAVQRAHGTHPTSWALEVSFQISSFFIPLGREVRWR